MLRELHPAVSMFYFIMLLFMTMFTLNPVIITVSFVMAFFGVLRHKGVGVLKMTAMLFVPILLFSVIILPLFNHNGVTPLFYINDMAVTLENIIYGLVMTIMLMAVSLWFITAGCMIDSEKILYITGKISPKISLVISMVLRFIPMMVKRWREIHEAQIGMLCTQDTGVMSKAKQFTKELSILVSWSLENSIDTSVSMESRGYGTGRRSSYHRFRIKTRDILFMAVFTALSVFIIYILLTGRFETYYFPEINIRKADALSVSAVVCQWLYMCAALI
nr:energy-coupling factor transporter transmembrane component T [Eubacterium sp. MSJ-13]